MGGAVFPLCWPVFGRGNVGNGNLLQKDLGQHTTPMTVVFSAPDPRQAIVNPHLRQRLLDTHKHVWLSLLWSHFSFLLDPGMHEVCALRESISPVLWKFCNQIPLAFKVKFPESSVCLPDPQVGKSAVGPRSFAAAGTYLGKTGCWAGPCLVRKQQPPGVLMPPSNGLARTCQNFPELPVYLSIY